jgi:hypothetical protein
LARADRGEASVAPGAPPCGARGAAVRCDAIGRRPRPAATRVASRPRTPERTSVRDAKVCERASPVERFRAARTRFGAVGFCCEGSAVAAAPPAGTGVAKRFVRRLTKAARLTGAPAHGRSAVARRLRPRAVVTAADGARSRPSIFALLRKVFSQ